jgi:hypothetical protein
MTVSAPSGDPVGTTPAPPLEGGPVPELGLMRVRIVLVSYSQKVMAGTSAHLRRIGATVAHAGFGRPFEFARTPDSDAVSRAGRERVDDRRRSVTLSVHLFSESVRAARAF